MLQIHFMESYIGYIIGAFSFAGILMVGLSVESICHLRKQQRILLSLQDDPHET